MICFCRKGVGQVSASLSAFLALPQLALPIPISLQAMAMLMGPPIGLGNLSLSLSLPFPAIPLPQINMLATIGLAAQLGILDFRLGLPALTTRLEMMASTMMINLLSIPLPSLSLMLSLSAIARLTLHLMSLGFNPMLAMQAGLQIPLAVPWPSLNMGQFQLGFLYAGLSAIAQFSAQLGLPALGIGFGASLSAMLDMVASLSLNLSLPFMPMLNLAIMLNCLADITAAFGPMTPGLWIQIQLMLSFFAQLNLPLPSLSLALGLGLPSLPAIHLGLQVAAHLPLGLPTLSLPFLNLSCALRATMNASLGFSPFNLCPGVCEILPQVNARLSAGISA